MKNTSKISKLTNDLKNYLRHMEASRLQRHPQEIEIEFEIDDDEASEEDEGDSPSDFLLRASGMLLDCSVMVAKAAFLVTLMEKQAEKDAEDTCDCCPYRDALETRCGAEYGTMVLIARPDGDNTVMTLKELTEEIGDIFDGRAGACEIKPVPGAEDLYYTLPEKKPLRRNGNTYYRGPAVIFGINEDAGEVVSPNAKQLYTAARYFENAAETIKTREDGETAVFCLD